MASDTPAVAVPVPAKPAKRRGSYNCGRCGQPKKGHVCTGPSPSSTAAAAAADSQLMPPPPPPPPKPQSQLIPPPKPRRALQFDDPMAITDSVSSLPPVTSSAVVLNAVPLATMAPMPPPPMPPQAKAVKGKGKMKAAVAMEEEEEEEDVDDDDESYLRLPCIEVGQGREWRRLPGWVLTEVMRWLTPREIAAAAVVSRGWRDCTRFVWGDTEGVRLRASEVRPVAALVARCPTLASLVLKMDRDVDAQLLACIAFSCPNLQSLDINMANSSANRITGDELSRFVSEKRSLSVLKLNGCSSLRVLDVSSSSLSTLWIAGLCSLTKAVLNCPNLNELSLAFPEQNNDSTDLVALMDSLGHTCPNLRSMHISSVHLCNEVVFALESANLRGLSKLCLILGSKINDAAVASIVRSYPSLELLDLSGSGITDNGVVRISKTFPNTLTHLLLAMCPNITLNGAQVAVAELPLLCLMDLGMSICATPQPEAGRSYFGDLTGGVKFCSKLTVHRKQLTTRPPRLIIKHNNLKKLSLFGCSGIDCLSVDCPELVDLNLNMCTNLDSVNLVIHCPKLKDVHINGCREEIRCRLLGIEPRQPCKRLADGSKRVYLDPSMIEQLEEPEKWGRPLKRQCTVHLD